MATNHRPPLEQRLADRRARLARDFDNMGIYLAAHELEFASGEIDRGASLAEAGGIILKLRKTTGVPR